MFWNNEYVKGLERENERLKNRIKELETRNIVPSLHREFRYFLHSLFINTNLTFYFSNTVITDRESQENSGSTKLIVYFKDLSNELYKEIEYILLYYNDEYDGLIKYKMIDRYITNINDEKINSLDSKIIEFINKNAGKLS